MSIRIPAKHAALYIVAEGTAGTYVAPTQNSDKALRLAGDIELSIRGGIVSENEDVMPTVGGFRPFKGATGWSARFSVRVPVWPDLNSLTAHPLAAVLNAGSAAISLLNTPDRVLWTPSNRDLPGTLPITTSLTVVENDGNTYCGKGGVIALTNIRSEGGRYLVFDFEGAWQHLDTTAATVYATSGGSFTTAAAEYVTESYVNPKGRTLTLTGVDGSAEFCSDSFNLATGMAVTDVECGNATNGYGISSVGFTGPAVLSVSLYAMPELATSGGRQTWETMLDVEELSAVSIVCGSSANAFTLAGARGYIVTKARKVIGQSIGYDLGVELKASSMTAFDHLLMTWGA